MTLEQKICKLWNPNRKIISDKWAWLVIDKEADLSYNDINGKHYKIRISKNGSEASFKIVDDVLLVKTLKGSVVHEELLKMGFEEIPNEVLKKEVP